MHALIHASYTSIKYKLSFSEQVWCFQIDQTVLLCILREYGHIQTLKS